MLVSGKVFREVREISPEVRESFLEECDIGNVLTEGCDSTTCRVLSGYTCNKAGNVGMNWASISHFVQ